ncbi:hypothetical protein Q7A53_06160 [Halobacillus rhizosphaerae]|uniref:hypothetical protein n=1 Tax=Halobacillus rhizosphaerae TaxID=3064889 RepID=UPI00398BA645
MVEDKKKLIVYLNQVVNNVFKILPLFEEENVGVKTYIESLLFELYGLEEVIKLDQSFEYVSLLSTLESIKKEIYKKDSKKKIIKRETFKCLNLIKNLIGKLENE